MEYREFRAEGVKADDSGTLEGLVTPFGEETTIGDMKRGGFREEIAKGAFVKTLQEGDPLLVYQHDLTRPLARKSAGNLEMHEGEFGGKEGVVMRATPVDTTYAQDLRKLVVAKVVRGMSFGFEVVKDDWYKDDGTRSDKYNGTKRVIRELRCIEASPVTRPAYGGTAISARDEASALIEARQRYAETHEDGGAPEDRGPKPYGNVPYADPKNGKYPIDRSHVKAAWAYINQAKNAAKYPLNGVTLASVKARIKAAMKKFGFSSGSAGRDFEFTNAEWRDDDPYFDDWYEIDADLDEDDEGAEADPARSIDKTGYARMAAVLSGRSEEDVKEVIDLGPESFCVILRDIPNLDWVRSVIDALTQKPPDTNLAISMLQARLPRSAQEPVTSTPEPEDDDLALRMSMRRRELELESESTSNLVEEP